MPLVTPDSAAVPLFDTAAYHRVSTAGQAGDDRTSVPEQRRATAARAAHLGRVLDPRAVFEDLGVSGATAEGRPGFMALLAYCEAHSRPRGDGVVLVLNDSRFGRFDDPEEATHWRFVLKRLGWIVRFCEGDEIEDGLARNVMRLVGSAQASEYRANLRRTSTRASRATAQQGRWQAVAPVGYRRLATRGDGTQRVLEAGQAKAKDEVTRLTPGPEVEQLAVRFAFEAFAAGTLSLQALVDELNARFPFRTWLRHSINDLLKNPAYTGDLVWCRTALDGRSKNGPKRGRPEAEWVIVTDAHPALVSRALFVQVQQRLAMNRKETRATQGGYPLSGLVRCGTCDAGLVGAGGQRGPAEDPDRYRAYACASAYKKPRPCAGPMLSVPKRWIEPVVVREVATVVRDPRVQAVIVEELDRALDVAHGGGAARQQELERERRELGAKRARVVDAIASAVLTEREAATTLIEIRSRLEAVERERERLQFAARRVAAADELRHRLVALAANFEATALRLAREPNGGRQLRELLRPWIADAVLEKSTRTLTLVIRRVPDVFGVPTGFGGAGRGRVTASDARRVNAGARAAAHIDSAVHPAPDRQVNKTSRPEALFIVRRVKLPRATRNAETCQRGHALTGDNLVTNAKGWRSCRTCRRQRQRARAQRAKQARSA